MERIQATIVRQRIAEVVDPQDLHALLVEASTASHGILDTLIASMEVMLQASTEMQMNVMHVNMGLWRQLNKRPVSTKVWEVAAADVVRPSAGVTSTSEVRISRAAKHAESLNDIYVAAHNLQTRLRSTVRHLLDHQSQVSSIYSENFRL